jgi:hypothetical protein
LPADAREWAWKSRPNKDTYTGPPPEPSRSIDWSTVGKGVVIVVVVVLVAVFAPEAVPVLIPAL